MYKFVVFNQSWFLGFSFFLHGAPPLTASISKSAHRHSLQSLCHIHHPNWSKDDFRSRFWEKKIRSMLSKSIYTNQYHHKIAALTWKVHENTNMEADWRRECLWQRENPHVFPYPSSCRDQATAATKAAWHLHVEISSYDHHINIITSMLEGWYDHHINHLLKKQYSIIKVELGMQLGRSTIAFFLAVKEKIFLANRWNWNMFSCLHQIHVLFSTTLILYDFIWI